MAGPPQVPNQLAQLCPKLFKDRCRCNLSGFSETTDNIEYSKMTNHSHVYLDSLAGGIMDNVAPHINMKQLIMLLLCLQLYTIDHNCCSYF